MPLHRRSLVPVHPGDCLSSYEHGCSSPPSPPHTLHPTASPPPSPPPWSPSWPPCPPIPGLAPSPSPVHGAPGGRRDQGGTRGYNSSGGGAADHHHRFVTFIVIAAASLAFLSLILFGVSVAVRRRRRRRRRRQALLAPAPDAVANVEDGGNDDPEGVGGVVHHVWYIRTVGLDEAAINSIAVTQYRAGTGLLGAGDCSVCLGKFQDGELVRLLPKCGHAFHVPCIDTWLRAHVNCPLCRSDVLDRAATAAGGGGQSNSNPPVDPDANANAATEQVAAASDSILEHEEEENDQEAPPVEGDQHEQLSSPDPSPQQLPSPLPRNVRRAASMDAAMVSAAADVVALLRLPEGAPEEEQSGRQNLGTGASCVKVSGSGHLSSLSTERPASGGVPRSFFSRHCRARSSVLPL